MRLDPMKFKFLADQFSAMAWAASVQRANLYATSQTDVTPTLESFRHQVTAMVETDFLPQYKIATSEPRHLENLNALVERGTQLGGKLLGSTGYKLGVAQKYLNLLLKYHWCYGAIAEPPHCPIDRVVLSKTRLRNSMNWTQMTEQTEYEHAIDAVREEARKLGSSIAKWELHAYQRDA